MEPTKSITGMYTRFTNIVNNLKNLGKVYTNADLYRKILRSVPQTQDTKITAIQEARVLSILKVEELVRSLMTYEISLCQHEEEESKKTKEKGIALKADIEGESNRNYEDVESELSDFEIAFVAKKFRNFMKNKRNFPKKKNTNRKGSSKEVEKEGEKKVPMCYECNKLGYFKSECPHLSKEYKKKN